ncbi:MAG TPA: tetratricopeptide repeat protein [Desulfomonilaceae bacterium]|nr:tetratricopeptide repeat protein [Desulfomonilaceae bacterium]
MKRFSIVVVAGVISLGMMSAWTLQQPTAATAPETALAPSSAPQGYTGSVSCRKCHEKFYQLWAPSHHGLAMQPYSAEFAQKELTAPMGETVIGDLRYQADISGETGWVIERSDEGEKKYRIEHAMGGKNVYYFLTTLDRGRLQALPVAYDVRTKKWFDMAESGVRHFPGHTDVPVNWKEWPYTFNTACYGCHVSQVSTNYDPKTDSYHTVWKEPGINCETCHGPADGHIRVCEAAPKGTVPKDLKITRGGRDFTSEQNNATCSSCHAKAVVLTSTFKPGDKFFDHFDLVTLESPDYYPDGRDIGENYTYTSWVMSPCVKSGKLHCLHCHTSSGRYKFKGDDKANQACMPCHQDKVDHSSEHTHHKADSLGNKCISCHMPMTEFARMRRTDHSMLPPTPAGTMAFQSPNACNLCHKDKTPQWSDEWVRKWRQRDYQAAVLHRAGLIAAARARDWSRLPDMLAYLENKDRDEVFTASLIRLLRPCEDETKWPAVLNAMKDPSPLIRAAVAESLAQNRSHESASALETAATDGSLLVRIRSAAALSGFPKTSLGDRNLAAVEKATAEYVGSLSARPDHWASHYNLGNLFLNQGKLQPAAAEFQTASRLDPQEVSPLVNLSIVQARMGEFGNADESLKRALLIAPKNAPAHFNMGLLKAEQNDLAAAEKHLRLALAADPRLGEAAYNLSVILAKDRPDEAIAWSRKAVDLRPRELKYSYTLAFHQQLKGDLPAAAQTLEELIVRNSTYTNAYLLLGDIYEKQGQTKQAAEVYRRALATGAFSVQERRFIDTKLKRIESR